MHVENPVQKKSSGHCHQCLPCFKFIHSMQEVATWSHLAGDDVHQACQGETNEHDDVEGGKAPPFCLRLTLTQS